MLLTIDSGNTNTVFGLYDLENDRLIKAFRTITDPTRTADEYIVWLAALMELNGYNYRKVKWAVMASVVPEASFNLISLCRRYFNCEPVNIDATSPLGIKICIERPEQLGADRIVNALAGHQSYGDDLILIDFGTATTFDVVGKNGDYMGGIIAPGVRLSLRTLHMAAAKLPLVEIARPPHIIGKNTEDAMQSGVYWGYVAMIEGMIKRIESEYGRTMQTIATGGLSETLANDTPAISKVDRTLTLRGLAAGYRLLKQKK